MPVFFIVSIFVKNKSIKVFKKKKDPNKIIRWFVFAAILWYAALGVYGQGAVLTGEMGPVIRWTMFTALSLIVGNLWGICSGEWKGAKKTF